MKICDLKVGQLIEGNFRMYDYSQYLRIESVGYDWAVARSDKGLTYLLEFSSELVPYQGDSLCDSPNI